MGPANSRSHRLRITQKINRRDAKTQRGLQWSSLRLCVSALNLSGDNRGTDARGDLVGQSFNYFGFVLQSHARDARNSIPRANLSKSHYEPNVLGLVVGPCLADESLVRHGPNLPDKLGPWYLERRLLARRERVDGHVSNGLILLRLGGNRAVGQRDEIAGIGRIAPDDDQADGVTGRFSLPPGRRG